MCVCVGAEQPGCRYHPSPCHRPRGCWESSRQHPGSDNEGCILIFLGCRRLENATLLLPHHHPVQKPINPTVWEQSGELGRPAAACLSRSAAAERLLDTSYHDWLGSVGHPTDSDWGESRDAVCSQWSPAKASLSGLHGLMLAMTNTIVELLSHSSASYTILLFLAWLEVPTNDEFVTLTVSRTMTVFSDVDTNGGGLF